MGATTNSGLICCVLLGLACCCSTFSPIGCAVQPAAFMGRGLDRRSAKTCFVSLGQTLRARLSNGVHSAVCQLGDEASAPKRKDVPQYVKDLLSQVSISADPLSPEQITKDLVDSRGIKAKKRKDAINTEVYVNGLPFDMDRLALRKVFAKYDAVYARVAPNKYNTSVSLGFGFVGFKASSKANAAIRALNGTTLMSASGKATTMHLSFAASSSKHPAVKRRMTSQQGQRAFASMVDERKQQLTIRNLQKTVMSAEQFPRRWKAMADKVFTCFIWLICVFF